MSDVRRWILQGKFFLNEGPESPVGDWVRYSDYATLEAENAVLRKQLEGARKRLVIWESEGIRSLRAADKMADVCDDWVKRGIIDSRSAFADARLEYCDPYTHKEPAIREEVKQFVEENHGTNENL